MNTEQTFQQLVADTARACKKARPEATCPSVEQLYDYAVDDGKRQDDNISSHLHACESCRLVVSRMQADHYFWNIQLTENPGHGVALALGRDGCEVVNRMIRKPAAGRLEKFVSAIRENMVAWVSPVWQPMYAGEAVTAADVEVQSRHFEMEYGEYINLSCHWREEKESEPCIDLSWQANLMQPSTLWARFIDPESSRILTEIPLGSELEGKICISADQLSFNPTTDKWAIAIIVEE